LGGRDPSGPAQLRKQLLVVSPDLIAIYYRTESVFLMLKGAIVEEGSTLSVVEAPQHPYTKRLVQGVCDPSAVAGEEDDVSDSGGDIGASLS
jgi:ABC-type dipeptide/oligopeptide/nickel transport system ATPase component